MTSGFAGSMQATLGSLGGFALAGAATAGVLGLVHGFGDATSKAADLGETVNKIDVVFGDAGGAVKTFADEASAKFGLVRNETMGAAAGIGLIGKTAGLSEQEAASFSIRMVKLAADMSSLHNISMEDALTKLRAGLVGEAEPLRTLGVLLNEQAVKQEAVRIGLIAYGQELTDGQKVLARESLIIQQTESAHGDLERTLGSSANQLRKLKGDWEEFTTTVGQALLPLRDFAVFLASKVLGVLREAANHLKAFAEMMQEGWNFQFGGGAPDVGQAINKAIPQVKAAAGGGDEAAAAAKAASLTEEIKKTAEALKLQAGGFELTSREMDVYKLRQQGATEAQVSELRELGLTITKLELARDEYKRLDEAATRAFEETRTPLEKATTQVDLLRTLFEKGKISAEVFARSQKKINEEFARETKGTKTTDELRERGRALTEQLANPLEKYKKEVAELRDMEAQGFLSGDTAKQARLKAFGELKDSMKFNEAPRFTGALQLGSQEARSAVLAHTMGGDSASVTLKQILYELKRQGQAQGQQVAASERLANAAVKKKPPAEEES